MRGLIAALGAVVFIALVPAAQADVQPYATNDAGGFHDVLPPGANGLANGVELAAFLTTGAASAAQRRPARDVPRPDVRDAGAQGRGPRALLQGLDVRREARATSRSTITPRADVTIVRDKSFGIPHIYGTTRGGTMFGAGYAAAQDRLFFIDVLRHLGRAQLSSFIGGAPANRAMDAEQWSLAPYTEADYQRQFDLGDDLYGDRGRQLQDDALSYVAGINQYIAEARLDPTKMPGEYVAHRPPAGSRRLEGDRPLLHGLAGRRDLRQGRRARARRVPAAGRVQGPLRRQEGPHAVGAVRGLRRPRRADHRARARASRTRRSPSKRAKGAEEPPDPGSFKALEVSRSSTAPPATGGLLPGGNLPLPGSPPAGAPSLPGTPSLPGSPSLPGTPSLPGGLGLPELGPLPKAMSNALLVSGANSASGHPLAVFGPQVAYFAPQILMEEDLHGPGIDAKGVAFPGVNLYVQLGHGRDYAWSATSAGQDIIDTFAVPLCDATHYRFRGQCLPIEVLERKNAWTPNLADQTPPGAETLHAERTKLGLVAGRGTYKGKKVLYTVLRSTYQHEVDSAVGFSLFNEPGAIRSPQDFQRAASNIGYTFNWFYIDAKHIAYFNSGNNPVRAKGTTGQLPMASTNEWRDFNPDLNTARYTPFSPAPAGRRPAGAHELEQPPGAGLRGRRLEPVQLGLPLADARSPAGAAPAGRPQAHAARDGRRDGAGGHHRPARHDLPAARAARPGHAEGPRARRGRGQAEGMVGQRHPPHRPQPRRRSTTTPTRSGSWTPGGRGSSGAMFKPVMGTPAARPARGDLPDRQRAQQPRRPPRLGLPGGLLRLRAQGPQARPASARSSRSTPPPSAGAARLAACRKALDRR